MINPFDKISLKNKTKLLNLLRADITSINENKTLNNDIFEKNSIAILQEGHIQIVRNNVNGNKTIIDEYFENDVFELYYTYAKNDDYQIITKEKSKIIFIDINLLQNFNENTKQYYNIFVKSLFFILNSKMEEKNKRIQILTKKTIRNKLLEYFNFSNSRYVYLPFSFMALADYLGVDRSALSREIKFLKDEGFIEIKGKRITLLYR